MVQLSLCLNHYEFFMRVRATWVLSFQTLFSRENASENMQIFENLFRKYQGGGQAGLQNSYSGQKKPTPPTTTKEKTNVTEKSEVLNTYILEYSVVVVSSTSELILLPWCRYLCQMLLRNTIRSIEKTHYPWNYTSRYQFQFLYFFMLEMYTIILRIVIQGSVIQGCMLTYAINYTLSHAKQYHQLFSFF